MIQGLYQLKASKSQVSTSLRVSARRGGQTPQDSHASEVAASKIEDEIRVLGYQIADDEEIISQLSSLIAMLAGKGFGSAHRTLALRHLEDAQSRLLRELGDKA